MAPKDPVLNSVKLLIAVGSFAAKPGLLGGLKSGVSVVETYRKMTGQTPPGLSDLADELANSARATLDGFSADLPGDAGVLFGQMVEQSLPDPRLIVDRRMKADAICAAIQDGLTDPDHLRAPMPHLFRQIVTATLTRLLATRAFTDDLDPAFKWQVLDDLGGLKEMVADLRARSDRTARELGLKEGLVVALARRYAEGSPGDFDAALKGLEHALETAALERAKGRLPGKVSEAVEAVMARVDTLNDDGRIDEAAAELKRLDEAHKDEIARLQAARMRIVEKRVAQAVLTRDVGGAVALELERLALDGGGFAALRQVFMDWYERGRDQGLNFDLEVAIGLARAAAERAQGAGETGTALNDLGVALKTLGARESDTDRLVQAVTAYRAALQEWTRDRVPLDWAMTQNNLGTALRTLGARESGTDRLEEAVAAFEQTLKEYTRDRVPLDWAITQYNLGTLALAFFDKTGDVGHLDRAQGHLDAARAVFAEAGATQYLAQTATLQAEIDARRG